MHNKLSLGARGWLYDQKQKGSFPSFSSFTRLCISGNGQEQNKKEIARIKEARMKTSSRASASSRCR